MQPGVKIKTIMTNQMKNKIHDLNIYAFSAEEKIVIDANIWLYLFPPPGNARQTFAIEYSKIFDKLMKAQAKPVLEPIILSEYLNRYCRIEWDGHYKKSYASFKEFRQSPDFPTIAGTAKTFAMKILKACTVDTLKIALADLEHVLAGFASGEIDFNDALLVEFCKKQGYKFLTNDSDFQSGGIEILTANPKLLRAC